MITGIIITWPSQSDELFQELQALGCRKYEFGTVVSLGITSLLEWRGGKRPEQSADEMLKQCVRIMCEHHEKVKPTSFTVKMSENCMQMLILAEFGEVNLVFFVDPLNEILGA